MARIARALIALTLGLVSIPSGAEAQSPRAKSWYAPVLVDGKTFPVLLPADGKWLNWRDTYGAPRMRFQNGTWVQTGTHQGIDVFAEKGSPIVSMSPGVVENVGWTFYSGWRVGVRGIDGRYYFYAHLIRSFGPGIVKGARVTAGQVLGRLGNSGYGPEGTDDEFPPHLHFGLQGRTWQNPQAILEALYKAEVETIRASLTRIDDLEGTMRTLRSRAFLPGSPDPARLHSSLDDLRKQAETSRRSMLASL